MHNAPKNSTSQLVLTGGGYYTKRHRHNVFTAAYRQSYDNDKTAKQSRLLQQAHIRSAG